jgi:hypothetical protein
MPAPDRRATTERLEPRLTLAAQASDRSRSADARSTVVAVR